MRPCRFPTSDVGWGRWSARCAVRRSGFRPPFTQSSTRSPPAPPLDSSSAQPRALTPLLVPLLGGMLRAVLGSDADLLDWAGGLFVAALLRAVGIPTPRGGRPSFLDLEIVPVGAGVLAAILFWLLALSARPRIVRLVGAALILAVVVSARLWLFR